MRFLFLRDRVVDFCRAHDLLPVSGPNDSPRPLVVAVSGGADSLVLLRVLRSLQARFRIAPHVATFDHSLRGDAGAADVAFVQEIAAAWGVPCTTGRADVPALAREWRMGTEAAARRARYAFLAQTARQIGADCVATGHTRDDQAETVLMHVIRGSGLAGLRGMLPKAPLPEHPALTLIRPLLDTPRAEIDDVLREMDVTPRQDATNTDPAYTRNRIRREVMPLLRAINREVVEALARLAETVRDDYTALVDQLPAGDEPHMRRADFLALPVAVRRLWLRRTAARLTPFVEISHERTQAALGFVESGGAGRIAGRIELGGGLQFILAGDWVRLATSDASESDPLTVPWMTPGAALTITRPGLYMLPGEAWQVSVEPLAPDMPLPAESDLTLHVSAAPDQPVLVRTRRPGDMFEFAPGQFKKLSDVLINDKIPAEIRDGLPLLFVNHALHGFIAPRTAPNGHIEGVRVRVAPHQHGINGGWCFIFQRTQAHPSSL